MDRGVLISASDRETVTMGYFVQRIDKIKIKQEKKKWNV